MPGSSLKSFLLPAALLSSTVFATLTLPLAVLGSKPVDIRMQNEPVFNGQLRDVAAPYLGFAAALSIGTGVASIAVTGWRRSMQKSAEVEEQLSSLREDLETKESQLEALKLSEMQLAASGLNSFLQGEAPSVESMAVVDATPVVAIASPIPETPAIAPVPVAAEPIVAEPVVSQRIDVKAAVSALHPAQAFLSFAQAGVAVEEPVADVASTQVDELQNQLKQMMAQIEMLQGALQSVPQLEVARKGHVTKQRQGLNQNLHKVEPLHVPQKVAS